MGWSEDRLHRWLGRWSSEQGGVALGDRGHDAAVLRASSGRVVTCVDQTIEGVHFTSDAAPGQVGSKALGRALSDLAATAAKPRAVLLALAAPSETSEAWLRALLTGLGKRARALGAPLVGGDLACAAGPRSLSVTAVGLLSGSRRAPHRSRARSGQRVVLTGPVGGSSLGRHLRIEPRLELGARLWQAGATALIDVSDGLARDAGRVARASGVRVVLERVPEHGDARRLATRTGRSAREHALFDGEDHELLATMSEDSLTKLRRTYPDLQCIGNITTGSGVWVQDQDSGGLVRLGDTGGWQHGS